MSFMSSNHEATGTWNETAPLCYPRGRLTLIYLHVSAAKTNSGLINASKPVTLSNSSLVPNTHRVVRVEDVGGGGVVHDDDLVEVPAQATQVLDVIPSVEDARLPEKAAAERAPLVQEVGDRVCVLKATDSKR